MSRGSVTARGHVERAVLVGVDLSSSRAARRPGVEGARLAALATAAAEAGGDAEEAEGRADARPMLTAGGLSGLSTELSVDASLVEFRELVESAGAVVVAQVMQRRSRAGCGHADRAGQGGRDCRDCGGQRGRPGAV